MEVVNLENENDFVNTKVFVIDKEGNIYKNGNICCDIRHKVFLLEIAKALYPHNEIAKTLDEGDVSPYNTALIFNMLGFTVLLNSPTRNDNLSMGMPSYLMVLENQEPTEAQRESVKYCLSHFEGYCLDFGAKNLLRLEQTTQISWATITPNGIPDINPLEAYEAYLEKEKISRKLTI